MRRKLLWVRWRDASFSGVRWIEGDERYALKTVETSGFFIRQEGGVLEVGNDYDPELERWRGVTSIPVESIIKKKVITIDG